MFIRSCLMIMTIIFFGGVQYGLSVILKAFSRYDTLLKSIKIIVKLKQKYNW